MEASETICTNCHNNILNPSNFCPHCSQKIHVHRLSIGHLLHETVHFFTHADKGIFYLLKMLATKPGKVAREYIEGRRKLYFTPLNFFLIVLGLFVFVLTTFKPMQAVNMDQLKESVMQIPEREKRERRLEKVARMEKAINFTSKNSNYLNMALTPIIAGIFFLFYSRRKYNYTEHLVANLYFVGFLGLIFIFLVTPYLIITRNSGAYLYGIQFFLLAEVMYRSIAYYQFMGRKGILSYLYALLISILVIVGWYFLSTSLIGFYIQSGFRF